MKNPVVFCMVQQNKSRTRRKQVPNGDVFAVVDHAVGVGVAIGDEEADDDVDEEGELADDVE